MSGLFSRAPAHWRTVRLRQTVTACRNGVWGDEPRGSPDDLVCVRVADFDRQRLCADLQRPTLRFVPASHRRGRILEPGDLLLEKSGGGDGQPVGAVALYEGSAPAVCSNFIARMKVAPGFDARYLCYLHAALYRSRITLRSIRQTTGIQNLDSDAYLSETVRVPDLDEQRRLATFLERKTELLDSLVENRHRMRELLRERREALITRAVVRGLEPRAFEICSGTAWLGKIPAHWRRSRLKFIRSGALLYGANEPAACADPACPRYIRITDFDEAGVLRADTFQSLPEDLAAPYLLQDGDILLARSGATVGKSFRYREESGRAGFASYLVRLRPDRRQVLPDFLHYYTQSRMFRHQVRLSTVQSTIANVSAERYGDFAVPLPPLEEQQAIVESLDAATRTLDALLRTLDRQLAALHEYRGSLIVAAVTRGAGEARVPCPPG